MTKNADPLNTDNCSSTIGMSQGSIRLVVLPAPGAWELMKREKQSSVILRNFKNKTKSVLECPHKKNFPSKKKKII